MAFGPIMRFEVGELTVELAPLDKAAAQEFIAKKHGGGLQRHAISRYLSMGAAPVAEDEDDWFEKTRNEKDSLIWGIWLIEGDDRTIIGNSGLNGIGSAGHAGFIRQATSGSRIFRDDYWGRGIASAAHKARTWYAFTQLGLHRVKSAVIRGNGGSRKALERSGYSLVYTERNELYLDGSLRDMDCFECLNPLDDFWRQWWHSDRPSAAALRARIATREVLAWADRHVILV